MQGLGWGGASEWCWGRVSIFMHNFTVWYTMEGNTGEEGVRKKGDGGIMEWGKSTHWWEGGERGRCSGVSV